jgi:short-subunit dehydrogenase
MRSISTTTQHYVLITGSGAGFGKSLAFEFAAKGYNILLVSLLQEQLTEVQKELKSSYPAISCDWLAIDLLKDNVHLEIYDWVKQNGYRLCGLINNVGFGYQGKYENYDSAFFDNMIRLNVSLTHNMCRQFIDELKDNSPAFIHNVASLVAFYALPYKTVYAATKSFVLIYSRSLREEMKPFGIRVSCCCPGPMLTNFSIRKRIQDSGWRTKVVGVAHPDDIAKITVSKMMRNEGVIIPSFKDRALLSFSRLIPFSVLSSILGKAVRNSF